VIADVTQQLEVAGSAIVAFSPGLDATRTGQSMVTKAAADPLLDRASLDRLSNFYVADRLALRASDAEVDVVLDVTAKVPHVFQSFTGVLDEADEALDRAALFLRQRVRG
jgi:epsilon-lactone hydrolase